MSVITFGNINDARVKCNSYLTDMRNSVQTLNSVTYNEIHVYPFILYCRKIMTQ